MIEHRMLAPCFLEALDQDGVLGLQENDAVVDAARAQFVQVLREIGEEGAVASRPEKCGSSTAGRLSMQ